MARKETPKHPSGEQQKRHAVQTPQSTERKTGSARDTEKERQEAGKRSGMDDKNR